MSEANSSQNKRKMAKSLLICFINKFRLSSRSDFYRSGRQVQCLFTRRFYGRWLMVSESGFCVLVDRIDGDFHSKK